MAYDAQWINQLDPSNPAGTEAKSLGDNAIRELSLVLSNTFPNVVDNDPYTGTMTQLNELVGGATLPRGALMMYYPDTKAEEADGPEGWTVCDGRARKSGGGIAPNLISRFILGAYPNITVPGAYAVPSGTVGGDSEINIKTSSNVPLQFETELGVESGTSGGWDTTAGSPGHTHKFEVISGTSNNTGANIPPYFAAVYIIKD